MRSQGEHKNKVTEVFHRFGHCLANTSVEVHQMLKFISCCRESFPQTLSYSILSVLSLVLSACCPEPCKGNG